MTAVTPGTITTEAEGVAMTQHTLEQAQQHPAWDDTLCHARERAERDFLASFSIYFDGDNLFLRCDPAAPPPNATRVMRVGSMFRETKP